MKSEKELSLEEVDRLQALSGEWWELDAQAPIRMMHVIAEQERIELEILTIVLGERQ